MHGFTKRKFLSLSPQQQHKKCAELLRHLYDCFFTREKEAVLDSYHQFLDWMGAEFPQNIDLKIIADCYHEHLQKAQIYRREHHLLPLVRQGDRSEAAAPWEVHIYLDHIRSAHNVGSILRTTEALSLGTVYFSEQTPFIDHKQVQDTSMGAYAWVPCKQGISFKDLLGPIIALETSPEAISLYDFIFPEAFTLIIGNEEYGCSDDALKASHYLLEIPLRGHKNSLNVANAFAITAGEIYRQKMNLKKSE